VYHFVSFENFSVRNRHIFNELKRQMISLYIQIDICTVDWLRLTLLSVICVQFASLKNNTSSYNLT
jgi:hypothetical protein